MGAQGLPEKQRVSLSSNTDGVDFVTCAGAHNAQVAFLGLRCEADVSVEVHDLSGAPLPNVTILASNRPLSNSVFELPSAAEATTNKYGQGLFRLSDQKWTLELSASISAINPPETEFAQRPGEPDSTSRLEPDPNGGYNSTVQSCEGGTVPQRGPEVGYAATCNFDIPHSLIAIHFKSFRMLVQAQVAPVNVILAPGAGRSTLIADELQAPLREMRWSGVNAPRNRYHFELYTAGAWSVGAGDATKGARTRWDAVTSCSPGTAGPAPPYVWLGGIQSCQLEMPFGGGPAGSVSFGVPSG